MNLIENSEIYTSVESHPPLTLEFPTDSESFNENINVIKSKKRHRRRYGRHLLNNTNTNNNCCIEKIINIITCGLCGKKN
jgi:hypothetical protein